LRRTNASIAAHAVDLANLLFSVLGFSAVLEHDEYQLEDLARGHGIGAGLFVPFVIQRLRTGELTEAVLSISLRDIGSHDQRKRSLKVKWLASSAPEHPLGVSENTITEWAALGIACIVASLYAELRIQAVTAQGDRFDYWVSDGSADYGLEVSGTLTEEVESRHASKIRQWQRNPYGVDGYVLTAGFSTSEVIFSFHRFEENYA
jgi:hypothetical protein